MIIKNIYDYIKFNISGNCFLYNAETNQKGTYIVMSQVDDVIRVETFAPNIGNDKTFPNFGEFTRVETALTELIPFTLKKGELKRNSSGLWSQIIEFKAFMYGNGTMRIKRPLNDGYGGVTTANEDNPCVCYVDSWNITNDRVDIAINKQYVVGSSILFNGNEFVVHSYKPINNNFTLCLTYKKSLTE